MLGEIAGGQIHRVLKKSELHSTGLVGNRQQTQTDPLVDNLIMSFVGLSSGEIAESELMAYVIRECRLVRRPIAQNATPPNTR